MRVKFVQKVLPQYIVDIQQILELIKNNLNLNMKINFNDPSQLQDLYEFLDELLDVIEFLNSYKILNVNEEEVTKIKKTITRDMELISESIDKLMYESV